TYVQAGCLRSHRVLVIQINCAISRCQSGQAVERATIQQGKPCCLRHQSTDGAFSRTAWAIDSDYRTFLLHLVSPEISSAIRRQAAAGSGAPVMGRPTTR